MTETTEKYVPVLHTPVQLKPKGDLKLRKEDGQYLASQGDTVIYTTYWARRLIDEEIEIIGPGVIAPEPEAEPAKSQKPGKAN